MDKYTEIALLSLFVVVVEVAALSAFVWSWSSVSYPVSYYITCQTCGISGAAGSGQAANPVCVPLTTVQVGGSAFCPGFATVILTGATASPSGANPSAVVTIYYGSTFYYRNLTLAPGWHKLNANNYEYIYLNITQISFNITHPSSSLVKMEIRTTPP